MTIFLPALGVLAGSLLGALLIWWYEKQQERKRLRRIDEEMKFDCELAWEWKDYVPWET